MLQCTMDVCEWLRLGAPPIRRRRRLLRCAGDRAVSKRCVADAKPDRVQKVLAKVAGHVEDPDEKAAAGGDVAFADPAVTERFIKGYGRQRGL